MAKIDDLAWPAARLGQAVELLAQQSGFWSRSLETPDVPDVAGQAGNEFLGRWLEVVAGQLGLEVEPVESAYTEIEQLIRGAGPALLRLPDDPGKNEPRFLVLLKSSRGRVNLIGPDLTVHRVKPNQVRAAFCYELEAPRLAQIDRLLDEAGVPAERRTRVRQAILREQLGPAQLSAGWLLRLSPGTSLLSQIRHARLSWPMLAFLSAHLVQQGLQILAWWIIGRSALQGHFDWAWLLAWALLLFTAIPFQLLMSSGQSSLAIGAGGLFKQRLLYGALQLEPEEVRHQGAGQFLGRVMESEAVELLALAGGLTAVLALVELAVAAWILSVGSGGWPHSLLLLSWTGLTILVGWLYFRQSRPWIDAYRHMTNDLVERMVGHRTRLAQEDRQRWHDEEDLTLTRYLKLSQQLDRTGTLFQIFPRGWLILGLAGLAYPFIFGLHPLPGLAIALGGVILAFQALSRLMTGLISVVGAMLAWQQVAPLFQAARRGQAGQPPAALVQAGSLVGADLGPGQIMLEARDLAFRYRQPGRPVLQACSLRIRQGDRLLLEGPSGGGKSTLAALLAGLRLPESGLLLLQGLDRQTLGGAEWRRRVVVAPQFHENHVLSETFAFNLLMGRTWPAGVEELAEAETICRELGLGDLLDRMPAGFQQMVGESGWQLSHGERSRLYIARTLLQNADLIILDESLAALDPENLERALRCVFKRAPTLLVIAHP
jgi:ATP-binding cassette subfamily B protein